MGRNYGLGTRDMGSAGRIALAQSRGAAALSFSTVGTIADRWRRFALWAKQRGIGRLERVDFGSVCSYGRELAERVRAEEMAASTAQNYVSAVNTVMGIVSDGKWENVSPTKDCGIVERCAIRTSVPDGYEPVGYALAVTALRDAGMVRQACIAELAREMGLRSKEASMLNSVIALAEARKTGQVTITEGTKGGRSRNVPASTSAVAALERAAQVQGKARNVLPQDESWKSWREGGLRDGREALQAVGIARYHELRAAFACARYRELSGREAPAVSGKSVPRDKESRAKERELRLEVAAELGHGRVDVVSEYVGGR